MAWKIVSREHFTPIYDIMVAHVPYYNCTAVNRYLIKKTERRIPRELLESRKIGETDKLGGGEWIEGRVK